MTTTMTAHKQTINCLNEPNRQSATNSLLYRMYHGLLIKQFNETNKPTTKEICLRHFLLFEKLVQNPFKGVKKTSKEFNEIVELSSSPTNLKNVPTLVRYKIALLSSHKTYKNRDSDGLKIERQFLMYSRRKSSPTICSDPSILALPCSDQPAIEL
uniref:Uncharacterized protein n=1 Tax=Glossina austeni TaxID=7395 RepID=A0A1A9UMZ0_GLOAU